MAELEIELQAELTAGLSAEQMTKLKTELTSELMFALWIGFEDISTVVMMVVMAGEVVVKQVAKLVLLGLRNMRKMAGCFVLIRL